MENFAAVFITALLILGLLRLIVLPIRLGVKILLNSACGFLCLFLLEDILTLVKNVLYATLNTAFICVVAVA